MLRGPVESFASSREVVQRRFCFLGLAPPASTLENWPGEEVRLQSTDRKEPVQSAEDHPSRVLPHPEASPCNEDVGVKAYGIPAESSRHQIDPRWAMGQVDSLLLLARKADLPFAKEPWYAYAKAAVFL